MGIIYFLRQMTITEKLKYEVKEVIDEFISFFQMIKENTFDVLANKFGSTTVTVGFFFIAVVLIMLILTAFIRK